MSKLTRRIDDLGRVVIPKEIRKLLHIKEGDALGIDVCGDMICISRVANHDASEISIDGCVDVSNNQVTPDEFTNRFLDWLKENNWKFGGGIKPYERISCIKDWKI